MRQVYDFSNAKVRCHAAYYVAAKGKNPTPKEKYEQLQLLLAEETQKYDDMGERKQGMHLGLKKASKIAGLEYDLKLLEPKKYDDPLPAGAKSYLKRLYGYLKYGKWSATLEKGNKYTDKGKMAEPAAIELVNSLDNRGCIKNTECFFNDLIEGTPDIVTEHNGLPYIIDVKSSWDWETFAENIGKPLNPLYWWQLQAYLDVTDSEQGEVSYCLVDTPEIVINEELYKLSKRMGALTTESPEYKIAEATMINNMTFSDMPEIERRLLFPVKRDEAAIQRLHYIIPKCRDYLFELQEMHLTGYFTDKELPILSEIEEI